MKPFIQSHKDESRVMPRLRVMSVTLFKPGSLRTEFCASLPLRYSTTSISTSRPETSLNDAVWMPSISTRKLHARKGSVRVVGDMTSLLWETTDDAVGGSIEQAEEIGTCEESEKRGQP